MRFPAFLRRAGEHDGNVTGLLRDHGEVDQAIVRALLSGLELEDILIVEFCDTSPAAAASANTRRFASATASFHDI